MIVPCVLRRISNGEILNYNINYPNADPTQPVIGLDPDLEILCKYIPFGIPDYDSRIYLLGVFEGPGSGATEYHPTYPNLKQWRIEYQTIKRLVIEQIIAIRNAEELSNTNVFPKTKQLKYLTLGIGILNRKIDGASLTPKEITLLELIHDKALSIWQNDQNGKDMIELVDISEEPDIDSGWINIDPENE